MPFSNSHKAAQPDLDLLLDYLSSFGQKMLAEHQSFHPCAAIVDAGGELQTVHLPLDDDSATVHELLERHLDLLKSLARPRTASAVGLCYDGMLPDEDERATEQEAICMILEHSDGESIQAYLPYKRQPSGEYSYGEGIAMPDDCMFFPAPERPRPHPGGQRHANAPRRRR